MTRGGYDSFSITSLCKSTGDCFAEDKKVAGSVPARALSKIDYEARVRPKGNQ